MSGEKFESNAIRSSIVIIRLTFCTSNNINDHSYGDSDDDDDDDANDDDDDQPETIPEKPGTFGVFESFVRRL